MLASLCAHGALLLGLYSNTLCNTVLLLYNMDKACVNSSNYNTFERLVHIRVSTVCSIHAECNITGG